MTDLEQPQTQKPKKNNKVLKFFKSLLNSLKTTFKEVFLDWRTAIVFIIVFIVVSSEVWVPYLLGVIFWGTPFSATMMAVGSACWIFWLGPGTPFLPLCLGITVAIKKLMSVIRRKYGRKK